MVLIQGDPTVLGCIFGVLDFRKPKYTASLQKESGLEKRCATLNKEPVPKLLQGPSRLYQWDQVGLATGQSVACGVVSPEQAAIYLLGCSAML